VWTLPDPEATLWAWVTRLRPGGTLLLVEGRWREAGQSGVPHVAGAESLPWHGGVTADDLARAVRPLVADLRIEPSSSRGRCTAGRASPAYVTASSWDSSTLRHHRK
jgi:hypothetical protein